MLYDLIRALPAAIVVLFVPGWFWARVLRASADLYEQITFSVALSMALVPAALLVPTRLLGEGITLLWAVVAPLLVLAAGLVAYLSFGPAKGPGEPLAPPPPPPGTPALLLLIAGLALGLAAVAGALPRVPIVPLVTVGVVPDLGVVIAIVVLVCFAGIVHVVESRQVSALPAEPTTGPGTTPLARRLLLPAVLVLALVRGYSGPVLHDWPFIRGVDHYSHAVMAQLMMSEGRIEPYLIYPPGFHASTAAISRLTGLEPLELFPVLAPLLLLLPALALYVLANRLWGWQCGVAAALFSVLLGGTYYYYNDAMYPNFVTSQFLMVLTVAALVAFYASPHPARGSLARVGLLLAILGSSVVLYHQVASLYLAAILAVVGLVFVPHLLLRDRPKGVALFLSLASLGLLSVLYAWETYDLGGVVAGILDGSSGSSSTGAAVAMAVGTQRPYPLEFLLGTMVSQPVAWLGLLGVFLVTGELLWRRTNRAQTLAYLTLVLWALLLFVGSRSSLTGFPQRFGRDLCVPLAVFAALAFVVVLRSLLKSRKETGAVFVASLAVLTACALVGVRMASSLQVASGPSVQMTITPEISAAGEWLREHNDGGNIMVSPHINQVPSRMMLAMGDYSALQSFERYQIESPRDLPPTGPQPLKDVLYVMTHPSGERTDRLLEEHDVDYVVLYKDMPDRLTVDYWKAFEARPDLYRTVFENADVLIVARRGTAPAG